MVSAILLLFFSSALAQGPAAQPAPAAQAAPQFQSSSAAAATATQTKAESRAAAINATIGECNCKVSALSRAASKKPLGKTTIKDFKNRPVEVTVVNDEYAIKLFQEMTVQGKIPFGFPEDGCFARAHEMAYQLDHKQIYTTKVIATGKFLIDTEKAAGGSLTWSWHIAPAIVVDNGAERKLWVIDPSLFYEPVPLESWLNALTTHPKSRLTSAYVTRRFVYHPNNRTRDLKAFDKAELKAAARLMKRYLKRESLRDQKNAEDI